MLGDPLAQVGEVVTVTITPQTAPATVPSIRSAPAFSDVATLACTTITEVSTAQ